MYFTMTTAFTEIDDALAHNDIKRAEVAIAKRLRGENGGEERAELLLRRARARLLSARPDDALEDVETALALLPQRSHDGEIKVLLGDIYFARFELAAVGFADRQDTETALRFYQEALAQSNNLTHAAWVHYQIGRIQLTENNLSEAVRSFQDALTSPANPEKVHALAYERMGFIELLENRHPQEALEYFLKAREAYPPNEDAGWLVQLYLHISRAHRELEQHEAALEAARRALRTIQDSSISAHRAALPEAHLALAEVMAAMSGYENEAIEHFLRFLQSSRRPPGIDVTWSQVHETIGQLFFRLENYQQAINAFEKAIELNPYHPWEVNLRYQIARCQYRMRAYESTVEAIKRMQNAAEKENTPLTDWRVFNLLGNAYFALEKYSEAAQAYRAALQLAPSGGKALEKTRIYLRFSEELSQSSG